MRVITETDSYTLTDPVTRDGWTVGMVSHRGGPPEPLHVRADGRTCYFPPSRRESDGRLEEVRWIPCRVE